MIHIQKIFTFCFTSSPVLGTGARVAHSGCRHGVLLLRQVGAAPARLAAGPRADGRW